VGLPGTGSAARLGANCTLGSKHRHPARSHADGDNHTAHRQPGLRSSASRPLSTARVTGHQREACARAAGAAAKPALRAELRHAAPERERAGLRAAGQPRRLQRDEPPAGRHRRRHAAAARPRPRPFRPHRSESRHQAGAASTAPVSEQPVLCTASWPASAPHACRRRPRAGMRHEAAKAHAQAHMAPPHPSNRRALRCASRSHRACPAARAQGAPPTRHCQRGRDPVDSVLSAYEFVLEVAVGSAARLGLG
jgi:hypothetical protein